MGCLAHAGDDAGCGRRLGKHPGHAENTLHLARDCFPEPPTPTSIAFPRGWLRMRVIRHTCSMACVVQMTANVLQQAQDNLNK